MKSQPFDPETVDATRARIDEELARARIAPDMAAVLERARELGVELPDARENDWEGEAHLDDPGALEESDDGALAPYTDALRERLESQLAERRLLPTPRPRAITARRRRRVVTFAVAAAAVVLVTLGLASSPFGPLARQGAQDLNHSQAVDEGATSAREREAVVGQRVRATGSRSARVRAADAAPEAPEEPEESSVVEETAAPASEDLAPEPAPETAKARRVAKPRGADAKAPKQDVEQTIAALEAKAQQQWRRGELKAARATFREVIRGGRKHGKRRSVEIAHGELFSLARQLGGDRAALWRAYLKEFPRGMYAEDAMAGLCRQASGAEREKCWETYRARFPGGTHDPASAERSGG